MGVAKAKVANNYNDLVKGSLTRQILQNSKVYAIYNVSENLCVIAFMENYGEF